MPMDRAFTGRKQARMRKWVSAPAMVLALALAMPISWREKANGHHREGNGTNQHDGVAQPPHIASGKPAAVTENIIPYLGDAYGTDSRKILGVRNGAACAQRRAAVGNGRAKGHRAGKCGFPARWPFCLKSRAASGAPLPPFRDGADPRATCWPGYRPIARPRTHRP